MTIVKKSCLAFASVVLIAGVTATSDAATMFTDADGADSAITTAGNWDNGVPDNSGNAGTVTNFATTLAGEHDLDSKDITYIGTASLTGTSAGVKVEDSVTTFNDSSSWVQTGTIAIGRDAPGAGTTPAPTGVSILNINDNASVSMDADLKLSRAQNATLNQTGGSLNTGTSNSDQINIGNNNNGGVGTYVMSGGTATAGRMSIATNGSSFDFTLGSTGVLTILNSGVDYTSNFVDWINLGDITVGGSAASVSAFDITFTDGVSTSIQLAAAPIPEPSSLLLLIAGVSMTFAGRRK